jgi:hypothetical protein
LTNNAKVVEAKVAMAQDKVKFDFTFTVDDVIAQGFGPKARVASGESPDFFMDLQPDQWQGRDLHFELYRQRISDYLDIMTGKAFIEDKGQTVYESGISMWEQAN